MARRNADLETTIAGIPCGIVVTHFYSVKGNDRADNPWDYHGYTEMEYEVVDRRGYKAAWLEAKVTPADDERIEREYIKHMSQY